MADLQRARTTAVALCVAAALTGALAVLIYTGTFDTGLDPDMRVVLTGVLGLGAVMDLVMARVMYLKLSTRK